uniref:YqaJ n=1 Tax=uncultured bacterium A1Q1_fos_2101 TaxID=1256561 RepID=L7W297_9BACT|nr:YqaJ [uncultured bacterium A1Q1_fos_2101]
MTDDPEWLKWRRQGITATDVADAINNTYGGAYSVVARKLGLVTVEPNAAMDRGHRWEQRIADAAGLMLGLHIVGEQAWCQHEGQPLWRATIDGLLADRPEIAIDECVGLLEIKTVGLNVTPKRDRWFDQTQWQMMVTNMPMAVIAEVRIDDVDDSFQSLKFHRVEANHFRQAELVEVARQLWAHIEAETLPTPVASSLDDVKALSAPTVDETVDLEPVAEKVRRLHELKAAVKASEEERDLLEAELRTLLGDNKKGICSGFKVSQTSRINTLSVDAKRDLVARFPDCSTLALDLDAMKARHPEELAAAKTPTGAPRLTIKEITQ